MNGLQKRIFELTGTHSGLRELARRLDIDAGYLSRLSSGTKTNPSATLLFKLGLKRVVTYVEL